jgi:hypothetical protein
MEVGCVIFGMKHKKDRDKCKRERSSRLERRDGLEGFQTADMWPQYLEHMTFTVRCWQPEPANSWFGDNAHRRLCSVCCTCETDDKINLNEIYH